MDDKETEDITHMLDLIVERLKDTRFVSAAWLFGSVATGKTRKDSDIDIAILFRSGFSKYERFDLRLSLIGEFEELIGQAVDVIDIQSVPFHFQHQIRKTGKLILEKDRAFRIAYDVHSRRSYFDIAPVIEMRNQTLISRVIGGKQNG